MGCTSLQTHRHLVPPLVASLLIHSALLLGLAEYRGDSERSEDQTLIFVNLRSSAEHGDKEKNPSGPKPENSRESVFNKSRDSDLFVPVTNTPVTVKDVSETPKASTKPKVRTRARLEIKPVKSEISSVPPDKAKQKNLNIAEVASRSSKSSNPSAAENSPRGDSGQSITFDEGSGDVTNDLVNTSFGEADGPRLVSMPSLQYPPRARRLRREGRVLLLLEIDPIGNLKNLSVLETAGFGFDEAALKAVSQAHFQPAERSGHKVACRASLPVVFRLESP